MNDADVESSLRIGGHLYIGDFGTGPAESMDTVGDAEGAHTMAASA